MSKKEDQDVYLTKYSSDDESSDKDTTPDKVECKVEENDACARDELILEITSKDEAKGENESAAHESNETEECSVSSESDSSSSVQVNISRDTSIRVGRRNLHKGVKKPFDILAKQKHSCCSGSGILEFDCLLEQVYLSSTVASNSCRVDDSLINRLNFCKYKDCIGSEFFCYLLLSIYKNHSFLFLNNFPGLLFVNCHVIMYQPVDCGLYYVV